MTTTIRHSTWAKILTVSGIVIATGNMTVGWYTLISGVPVLGVASDTRSEQLLLDRPDTASDVRLKALASIENARAQLAAVVSERQARYRVSVTSVGFAFTLLGIGFALSSWE